MASPLAKVGFQWSDTKRRAVVLLVEGNKSYQRVADELGITRITLWEWRRSTDFAAALDDLRALLEEETRAFAVANRHALLEGLTERRERLLQIVTEREEYHRDHQTDAPGATTGYLVKSLKVVGTGSTAYTETEYNVDRPLVTSLNDVETFGAKLAGILTDKVDAQLDIHVGPPTVVRIRDQHPNPYAPNNETNLPPPGCVLSVSYRIGSRSARWASAAGTGRRDLLSSAPE